MRLVSPHEKRFMNRLLVFLGALFFALLFVGAQVMSAPEEAVAGGPASDGSKGATSAASAPVPAATPDPHAELRALPADELEKVYTRGVWRDGKAVFSDWKALDVFLKYARGYRPEQPIKFSHFIHVSKNKMECTYCHSGVNKSSFATIPSVESCMGCHKLVRTDRPEIQKLKKYFEEKRPVEWQPVYNLPEHAHFNHERHLKAGVGCQSCHGQVAKMEVVEKVSSLKMGWCVSCHRERGVSIDCATCHY